MVKNDFQGVKAKKCPFFRKRALKNRTHAPQCPEQALTGEDKAPGKSSG